MTQPSLGLIETIGLSAAVEAADVAVKSANVDLVGYQLTRGGGMVVVKIQGNVAAVAAAVAAASAAATRVGTVVATQVIARPANDIELLVINAKTVGVPREMPASQTPPEHCPEKSGLPSPTLENVHDQDVAPDGTREDAPECDEQKLPAPCAPTLETPETAVPLPQSPVKTEEENPCAADPVESLSKNPVDVAVENSTAGMADEIVDNAAEAVADDGTEDMADTSTEAQTDEQPKVPADEAAPQTLAADRVRNDTADAPKKRKNKKQG